jgi:hypothetical protein
LHIGIAHVFNSFSSIHDNSFLRYKIPVTCKKQQKSIISKTGLKTNEFTEDITAGQALLTAL